MNGEEGRRARAMYFWNRVHELLLYGDSIVNIHTLCTLCTNTQKSESSIQGSTRARTAHTHTCSFIRDNKM